MRVLQYVGALFCIGGLIVQTAESIPRLQKGLNVVAAVECPTDMEDDRRIEVVTLLSNGRTFLNSEEFDRKVMLAEVAGLMSSRAEPIVWVRAEGETNYGNVINLISELVRDTPTLRVALITEGQGAGPVNPLKWWSAWKAGQRFKFPYCSRSGDWAPAILSKQ